MTVKFEPTKFMQESSHFDKAKADKVILFIEQLKHTKGEWYNKPFVLLDWQREIIQNIFGVIKQDGNRQFTTAYIEIAKKQGKTIIIATQDQQIAHRMTRIIHIVDGKHTMIGQSKNSCGKLEVFLL